MSQITDTVVNFAGMKGDGNCVSVTDGMEVKGCGDGWERKTCFEGTDGDDTVCAVMYGESHTKVKTYLPVFSPFTWQI